MLAKVL